MVFPILSRRLFTRQSRQFTVEEIAEIHTQRIDERAIAHDKIHRHIKRIIDILLKAETVFKSKRQHAGAFRVGIGPDERALRHIAGRLAVNKGRIGKQRRRQRLQGQRNAQLFDHVGFRGKIEIDLHGGGQIHHLRAASALFGHIIGHQTIAPFRHARRGVKIPKRRIADAEIALPQTFGHFMHLLHMGRNFSAGLVNIFQWRAG